MPYVPPQLTGLSVPSLFDATPSEYPSGLFMPREPGSPDSPGQAIGSGALMGLAKTGNPFGLVSGASSAAGGFLGSKLASWRNNPGEKIGSTAGALAGSFLPIPFLGSLMGAGIGGAIGSNFGPAPTRGPNFQGWLGRNAAGQLDILGASGDNGIDEGMARAALAGPVNAVNAYLLKSKQSLGDLPKYFQIRAGGDGMDPTIEIGDNVDNAFLAPVLNDNSLLKALIGRGFVKGDLGEIGGPDPRRIFNGTYWMEPEAIHAGWQNGIYTTPSGYEALDPGRTGNIVQDLIASGQPVGETTLADFAKTYDPSKSLFTNQSLFAV